MGIKRENRPFGSVIMPYYNETLFKESLEKSVYYPACAHDGTPIKQLGGMFSNFVYSDYLTDH
jgi:hypothetical protein